MHTCNKLPQAFDLLMTFESEETFNAPLGCVIRHPEVFPLHQLYLRDRQADTHVRIKSYGEFLTVWASHCTLELAMH